MRERYLGEILSQIRTHKHTQSCSQLHTSVPHSWREAPGDANVMRSESMCHLVSDRGTAASLQCPNFPPLSVCVKCIESSLEVLCNWTDLNKLISSLHDCLKQYVVVYKVCPY